VSHTLEHDYRAILESLSDGVYFVDPDRRITFWNKGAEYITGFTRTEVIGHRCSDNILNHVDANGNAMCETEQCPLTKVLNSHTFGSEVVFLHHRNGHRIPVKVKATPMFNEQGQIVGATEIFSESVEYDLHQKIRELESTALMDPLTGIGNRRYLDTHLDSHLHSFKRYGSNFGIMMIDIDHFKIINDNFGHDIGDRVLKMVANTLGANIRASDHLGRFGGEEFVIILPNVTQDKLVSVSDKLRTLIESSFISVGKQDINVTISIGTTICLPDDDNYKILKRADRLLYYSKQNGRNRVSTD
jgi:diguanylate cyclase (GGDEF)-like protein/PAS domain S-box-containing protein